jgi:hypothetical protein
MGPTANVPGRDPKTALGPSTKHREDFRPLNSAAQDVVFFVILDEWFTLAACGCGGRHLASLAISARASVVRGPA